MNYRGNFTFVFFGPVKLEIHIFMESWKFESREMGREFEKFRVSQGFPETGTEIVK